MENKLDNKEVHICEQCGKKHNGSYGSGRFCNKTCRARFIASKIKHHVNNFPKKPGYGNWKCIHCNEIFNTRKELQNHNHKKHSEYCPSISNNKILAWNKGLTKENCSILLKSSITLQQRYENGEIKPSFLGKKHSEETKKKISEIMKQKLANGEIITPYIRNHHSKGPSYPEQYFMNVFKNANINVEYDFRVGLYQLDFANPKTKKYVEIDGDQHYFDKRIVEHDIKRTETLSEKGWSLIMRIKWSEFQKLSLSEREKICNSIIQQLQ